MDQGTLWRIVLVLLVIGAISWYRSGKKKRVELLTLQDKQTGKGCLQMALEVLGIAIEPDKAKTSADAIKFASRALEDHGMPYAIVVNVLSMGFVAGYIAKNQSRSDQAPALMLYVSSLLADTFKLNTEQLWDRSGELTKVRGPVGFLFQKAANDGVSLPNEVRESSVLADMVRAAIDS